MSWESGFWKPCWQAAALSRAALSVWIGFETGPTSRLLDAEFRAIVFGFGEGRLEAGLLARLDRP
jgi:hypothetical protein